METFVSDKVSDRVLIPLRDLLPVMARALPEVEETQWRVSSAYGYGLQVCEMDDALQRGESVWVSWKQICELANDPVAIFYHMLFLGDELGIEFGVFDSTFLLVRGGDAELHAALRAAFRQVLQRP